MILFFFGQAEETCDAPANACVKHEPPVIKIRKGEAGAIVQVSNASASIRCKLSSIDDKRRARYIRHRNTPLPLGTC